ncbi:unnamed protein product [Periconia digitata]|uniref:Uncharacterized protein n=1 Tax=Periconia digitata TaxID=1303443 RepID=A0A9W4UNS3_9PLEO|nr:unnamed protein product [Periconia digitata]
MLLLLSSPESLALHNVIFVSPNPCLILISPACMRCWSGGLKLSVACDSSWDLKAKSTSGYEDGNFGVKAARSIARVESHK